MAESQPDTATSKTNTFIDEDKNTKLHYAAAYGDTKTVMEEVEKGNEIDPVNYLDWTPLMMATRNGHTEVVEILLEKHADSTRTNKFGFNILLVAVACGKLNILQMILHHLLCGGVSKQSLQQLFSPVSLAVLFNNKEILQYLIGKGFCVNAPTSITEITPMMFATAIGNIDIINLLTAKGAKGRRSPVENQMLNTLHAKHKVADKLAPNIPPPLLLVSRSPFSPQPNYFCITPTFQMPRKCSDLTTPCFTPNISPLPPGAVVHQVFFPPNFSPSHFVSPVNPVPVFSNGNEFLNVRVMHPSPYYSPVVPYNSAN